MEQLLSIAIFLAFGFGFVLIGLVVGAVVRTQAPNKEKQAIYECGEPAIGSGWVQFDLRFYVVALFYLVFDVEVALIYPWAVVFREAALEALVLGAPFMAVILVGYAYEWYSGSLDWVRSSVMTSRSLPAAAVTGPSLHDLARIDPEVLESERGAP
ncbi:MAG: NADH-quinone oxidoreductase subunit A [Phycisphaerales bacterium]|nr:NADH-quinone oxidoreductase subunit A [Phycisphaerales bacterium]